MKKTVQQKSVEAYLMTLQIEWDDDLHGWIYCRGCKEHEKEINVNWKRYDYDSLYPGIYCDDCYNSGDPDLYPYRKDNYKLDEIDY